MEQFITLPTGSSPTGEVLCRICAGQGTSCCKTLPELTYLSFPISDAEWQRIVPYSGLATLAVEQNAKRYADEDRTAQEEAERLTGDSCAPVGGAPSPEGDICCAPEPNEEDFVASIRAVFPHDRADIDRLFPVGGTHLSMRTRKDGVCVFLGSSGCRLPREVRPWYCLLFPAWIMDGSLTLFLSPDCLISQRARGPAHGVRLLEESPSHIRDLYDGLRRDWGLKPR